MRRVLVVDDDKMNLKRTRLILEKYYDILTAESGQEALDIISDYKEIDLILLDIEMPGMSGIETFQRMKERGLDIPVIYLTASGHEDDVMNAIRLGAVNYLKKPFLPQDLMERIAKEFDKK